jgi:hypothetical protein
MIGFIISFILSLIIYKVAEKFYFFSIGFKIKKETDFVGFVNSCLRTIYSSTVAVLIVSYFAGPLSVFFIIFMFMFLLHYSFIDFEILEENYEEIRNKAISKSFL